jgi:L-seryl-tRNA(Ser) seleniumtransferase
MGNTLRSLPAVHEVLADSAVKAMLKEHAHDVVAAMIRDDLDNLRQRIREGQAVDGQATIAAIAQRVAARITTELQPKLRPVINATGILLHTNLGRAPLADAAARAAYEAGRGYLNLELDLESGKRSSRQDAIREWVRRLLGCESATVVNNNAAATVISLRALAKGKEVIVSRGQLVEIGGSFRIPEIMAESGAILKEVGATNITRIRDYAGAVTERTAVLLRVHCSNYRIHGHTEAATLEEMVALAKERGLMVIDDIGSGALVDFRRWNLCDEPLARESLAAGADLVLFSGDKLLGGPQAGILAGKEDLIKKIEKDPLMRTFRVDKMTLAALEATLRIYLHPEQALREIPVLRMLGTPLDVLRSRAESLAGQLRTLNGVDSATAQEDEAFVGGGSLPDQRMKTWIVALRAKQFSDAELGYRLRVGSPAVMTRLQNGLVLFDLRSLLPDQESALVAAIRAVT